ncbi:MAG: ADP-ribosylglycohydrolase family protein, partial [Oscillospiraceae bacterium]
VWCKYVPFACTAEEVAIKNLKKDIPIDLVGVTDNPYRQWIGAAIRSDGFAFASAGYPEKAASMAYYDGYLSHRRNGIYGEMFLAAAQSAAFTVSDPIEAIKIGLTEIPKNCTLYHDIEWALDQCATVTNYLDARRLVDQRFAGMHQVHTNNNLCLIVFGLKIGGLDIVKTLSQLIAMGLDNDCTAASAGSIVGAIIGKNAIPNYLCERFHNTMDTYLLEVEKFQFDDMAKRFMKIAKSIYH